MFLSNLYNFISQGVGLYLSLSLMLVAILLALFSTHPKVKRISTTVSIILCAVWFGIVSIANISLYFSEPEGERYFDYSMWAMIAVFVVIVVSVILSTTLKTKSKILSLLPIVLPFVAILVAFLLIPLGYEDDLMSSLDKVWIVLTTLFICLVLFVTSRIDKASLHSHTQSIVYASICIALSFALSYTTLWHMPQGGRVTVASLLPLMLYSYIFGVRKGIGAGFIYGLLQFIQNPYFVSPWQFLLDYSLAFACVGMAGVFRKCNIPTPLKFAFGAIVAGIFRYLSHTFSGVFAFGMYAPIEVGAWAYSLTYNIYVLVDLAIVVAVGCIALSSNYLTRVLPQEPQK